MSDKNGDPKIGPYIKRLEGLGSGERACLKRNAGRPLSEAREATALFFRILPPGTAQYQEEIYFLTASLYPLADGNGSGNLGDALRRAQNDKNRKGLDRRMEVLLDAEFDQLPFRLRQTIHFLQSNRVKVDWATLLKDLLNWNHPDRFVQQSWARNYYNTHSDTTVVK